MALREIGSSNGLCSSSTGSQIRRSGAISKSGTATSKTNATVPPASINLTIAAIILWKTIYLAHAVAELPA